jgi:hypothetical protein
VNVLAVMAVTTKSGIVQNSSFWEGFIDGAPFDLKKTGNNNIH